MPFNPATFRPLGDRILVKRLPLPEQTQSGLFMLGREYPTFGVVITIGPGKQGRRGRYGTVEILNKTLKVGDLVHFHKEVVRRELVFHELGDDYVLIDGEYCLLRVREI
jgi:co-chaperonin GroES (HSP10)